MKYINIRRVLAPAPEPFLFVAVKSLYLVVFRMPATAFDLLVLF
jgi:hypothetical protein